MTVKDTSTTMAVIIPYQELLGNYDIVECLLIEMNIIPYQELLGNYDYVAPLIYSR